MYEIPFLKPNLPKASDYLRFLEETDENRHYTNFGPLNTRFQERVLDQLFAGTGAVTTVNNCTSGLILAIQQSKRPGGKYALMPSFTFAATPLAAMWCGLTPYYVDIDPDEWSMDVASIHRTVDELGDDVGVIIPYATFGNNIDLEPYEQLQRSGIPVVIDAAPSFGAMPDEMHFGTDFSGFVVYSFHATKCFGIGEGGLVYSGDRDAVERLRQASNFGFSAPGITEQVGLNAKLPETSAAVALAALERFPEKLAALDLLYDQYLQVLSSRGFFESGWSIQKLSGKVPHQFLSILAPSGTDMEGLSRRLLAGGVEHRFYFNPTCHRQQPFLNHPRDDLKYTDEIAERIVSLPFWEGMTPPIIERIADSAWLP